MTGRQSQDHQVRESASSCGDPTWTNNVGAVGTMRGQEWTDDCAGASLHHLTLEQQRLQQVDSPDANTHTRTTEQHDFLASLPPAPPRHKLGNVIQHSAHILCVCRSVSVTSLSGWLWPFQSACGPAPSRRCQR